LNNNNRNNLYYNTSSSSSKEKKIIASKIYWYIKIEAKDEKIIKEIKSI
jgi:hypothetical protein